MLTSLLVAAIVGSPLAGWLLGTPVAGLKGWQVLFMLEAIPAVLYGILLLYVLVDWPKDAKWLSPEEKRALTEQYEVEIAAKAAVRKYTVWQALGDWEVLKLCLIYFMWITGFWGFNFWMPTVLKAVSGWSNAEVGWVVVIPMTLALIGFLFVGHSSSATGEKRWHVAIPMFIGAVGMGFGPFVHDPVASLALVCVSAIGVYVGMGVWWSYPTSFLSGAGRCRGRGDDQLHRQYRRLGRPLSDRIRQGPDRIIPVGVRLPGLLPYRGGSVDTDPEKRAPGGYLQVTCNLEEPMKLQVDMIRFVFCRYRADNIKLSSCPNSAILYGFAIEPLKP